MNPITKLDAKILSWNVGFGEDFLINYVNFYLDYVQSCIKNVNILTERNNDKSFFNKIPDQKVLDILNNFTANTKEQYSNTEIFSGINEFYQINERKLLQIKMKEYEDALGFICSFESGSMSRILKLKYSEFEENTSIAKEIANYYLRLVKLCEIYYQTVIIYSIILEKFRLKYSPYGQGISEKRLATLESHILNVTKPCEIYGGIDYLNTFREILNRKDKLEWKNFDIEVFKKEYPDSLSRLILRLEEFSQDKQKQIEQDWNKLFQDDARYLALLFTSEGYKYTQAMNIVNAVISYYEKRDI